MINIFGTAGPACNDVQILTDMVKNGMTGIRLNLSHAGLKESESTLDKIERAFQKAGRQPSILIDMQGPEMRIGKFGGQLLLKEGERVRLGAAGKKPVNAAMAAGGQECARQRKEKTSEERIISIPVKEAVVSSFRPGLEVKLDDGKLLLEIINAEAAWAEAVVIRGGMLSGGKSIALAGEETQLAPLTDADIQNIKLAASYPVTGLMQPFVRNAADIRYVRDMLKVHHAPDIKIYAKIENMRGAEALQEIMEASDEIVIARGDLGNAMPLWELPACQAYIAASCRREKKPFMVVTQMLSSMEHSKVPTRAEVSDIFHAVAEGAASVMVTGETAVGEHPAEVIGYLANTCREAEKYLETGWHGMR